MATYAIVLVAFKIKKKPIYAIVLVAFENKKKRC